MQGKEKEGNPLVVLLVGSMPACWHVERTCFSS